MRGVGQWQTVGTLAFSFSVPGLSLRVQLNLRLSAPLLSFTFHNHITSLGPGRSPKPIRLESVILYQSRTPSAHKSMGIIWPPDNRGTYHPNASSELFSGSSFIKAVTAQIIHPLAAIIFDIFLVRKRYEEVTIMISIVRIA